MVRNVPAGRQSIAPPRSLLIALLAVLLLFGVIWGVVTIAVAHDGHGCPSTGKVATESRCR
jgi:hypothetical protein